MKLYETMKRKIINIFKIKSYFASSIIEMCRKHANRHCCIDNLRFSDYTRLHHVTSMSLSIGRKLVSRRSLQSANLLSQVPSSLFSYEGCTWKVHSLKCTSTYDRVNFWSMPVANLTDVCFPIDKFMMISWWMCD